MKFEWEQIENTKGNKNITTRAKVFGGWMVKHRIMTSLMSENEKNSTPLQTASIGLCFIPDPEYKWEIEK